MLMQYVTVFTKKIFTNYSLCGRVKIKGGKNDIKRTDRSVQFEDGQEY